MLSAIRSVPVRVQLTFVLVLMVIAVASSLTYIAYRAAWRSLEEHAVASLEASARTRADSMEDIVVRRHERLTGVTKSLELACDTGSLNVLCANEVLRPFLRKEHARGARLSWRRNKSMTVGDFVPGPQQVGPVSLRSDVSGNIVISSLYKDEESGMQLEVQSAATQLREAALADNSYSVDVLVKVSDEVQSLIRPARSEESPALTKCFDGVDSWAVEVEGAVRTYRFYRYVPVVRACVVSGTPQAVVLAPIERLRLKLSKTVAGFIIGAAILAYLLGYLLAHPLTLLRKRIRALKRGDFESPVPVAGTGEIRDLSEAVASMATSLRTSRAALAQSEKKLMLAYKAARLWVWTYEGSTRTLTWQDPAEATGQARSESLRSALRRVDSRDRHALLTAMRGAMETGTIEVEFRPTTSGEERWMSASGQVLQEQAGEPFLMAGISVDTTSRKEAQRLEGEREKLMATADMAASLAHEINNPLSSVVGAVYMASSSKPDAPELKKYLTIAREESDRVAHIARQMLSLYRKPSSPEPVNVSRILKDVIGSCRALAERKQQKLNTDLQFCGAVLGFPDELRQAFMNVLTNAIEHSPSSGSIAIRAYRCHSFKNAAERGVRIVMANSGSCSLPNQTDSFFEPFVGTKTERGHGLGLWVTRSIVLKHGGTVRLRPYGVQRNGVCCVIYLPNRAMTS